MKLTGKVEEAEFSGVLTKYVLECHGQELKYLEKMMDAGCIRKTNR